MSEHETIEASPASPPESVRLSCRMNGKTLYPSVPPGAVDDAITRLTAKGATNIVVLSAEEAGRVAAELEAAGAAATIAAERQAAAKAEARASLDRVLANTAPLDDTALARVVAGLPECFDVWMAGQAYAAGRRLRHDGHLYIVVQAVTAAAHQPPGAEGLLAIYRPVDGAAGTAADPKTFRAGMDAVAGLHYAHAGAVWLALQSFLAHAGREPGAASADFWRRVDYSGA